MSQAHTTAWNDYAFPEAKNVSRRSVLKIMTAGSVMIVGGAALAACGGGNDAGGATNVTLTTNGWPFDVMPTADQIKKDPSLKGYADTLKSWLDKNPGVSLKKVTVNIWDQAQITNAVSAGTAPTWFQGDVLGGWNDLNTRSAFVRGMAADITPVVGKYQTESKLADYARAPFSKWKVDGKYYGTPSGFLVTLGFYYRRDLLQEAGIAEPDETYTWQDVRKIAKALTKGDRKGVALQSWLPVGISQANQEGLLSMIPSPSTPWHWRNDHYGRIADWRESTTIWRGMLKEDKSLSADATYGDQQVNDQFVRGQAGMMINNSGWLANMGDLEKKVGKKLDDIVGFISLPQGTNGAKSNSQPFVPMLSFDPKLARSQSTLDKAYALWDYMQFGQGYVDQKKSTYEATKNLRKVYSDPTPLNGMKQIPGIPGSAEEALGSKFLKAVATAGKIPLQPKTAWFFPAEKNPGPTGASGNDASSAIAYTSKDIDTIIKNWDSLSNKEEANFSSSVAAVEFKAAAVKYYAAHDEYWKANSPEFYTNVFKPWYEQKILPLIQ